MFNMDIYSLYNMFIPECLCSSVQPAGPHASPLYKSRVIIPLNLSVVGFGSGPEHGHQHEDGGTAGLAGSSDLPHDVCSGLRQQGLLICLPVPARRGRPVGREPPPFTHTPRRTLARCRIAPSSLVYGSD